MAAKRKSRSRLRTAAKFSVEAPRLLTEQGIKDIAEWVIHQLKCMVEHPEAYSDKGWFTSRFRYRRRPKK